MLLCVLAPIGDIQAAAPANQLLKLVGSDVGLCVEMSQLKDRLPQAAESDLFKRFQATTVYRQWTAGKDYRKLMEARQGIEKLSKKPFGQFASELFGESVVLAVYPVPQGEPVGVLLIQTASVEALESGLAVWSRVEKQKTSQRKYAGHVYFQRTKPAHRKRASETQYYFKQNRSLAVSDSEKMIQRVIGLANAETARQDASLVDSPTYRKAIGSLSADNTVSVFFNPRAWDRQVLKESSKEPVLAALWRRFESMALGIRVREGIIIEAVINYESPTGADNWSKFVTKTQGSPQFLKKVPERALAAFAGRFHATGIDATLTQTMNQREKKQWDSFRQVSQGLLLGLDLFNDVLPQFRPNWGGYVVRREKLQPGAVPVDGLLAFQIPPVANAKTESNKQHATVRAALDNALNTGLNLLTAFHNSKSPQEAATVRTDREANVSVRWIDRLGLYRPAYALTQDYLVFASSPRLIRDFVSSDATKSLHASSEFQRWSSTYFPEANQVLFLNVAQFRSFLSANWKFFVEQTSDSGSQNAQEVADKLSRFDDVLQLLDAAFVTAHIGKNRIHLIMGGTTTPAAR